MHPGGNVTGISDMSPIADHIALIKEITPNAKKVGVIYNPGEANSVVLVERLKELAGPAGLEIVESPATKSAEVQQATAGPRRQGRRDLHPDRQHRRLGP